MGDGTTELLQLGEEAVLAVRAMAEAVEIARAVEQDAASDALTKTDASPVTIADFSVQAVVAARLARDFPADGLVAEEDASVLRQPEAAGLVARIGDLVSRCAPDLPRAHLLEWIDRGAAVPGHRFWTLDPIDGTKGLLRGGQYAIALALIVDGTVRIGVLACPRLSLTMPGLSSQPGARAGGIAIAVRGRGASWMPSDSGRVVPLLVSAIAEPARARVLHSIEAGHSDVGRCGRMLQTLSVQAAPILMDSQAKHVVLASGDADVLVRLPTGDCHHDAIWDQAAGSVIVEEAGGRVTDLLGQTLDWSTGRRLLRNQGLVATNGLLHDAVLSALQQGRGASPVPAQARGRRAGKP